VTTNCTWSMIGTPTGPLLTFLTVLVLLTGSAATYAQTNTRSFQMALWTDPKHDADSDIAVFFGLTAQPSAGRTIWVTALGGSLYSLTNIDWSRIVAVEIDEPYGSSVDNLLKSGDNYNCQPAGLAANIASTDAALKATAAELKALAPKARFWVNFTQTEAFWMQACANSQAFNRDYIDVISTDWYDADFPVVDSFYAAVAVSPPKPDQQFALIPGVYSAPNNQLSHLKSYFDSANFANQTCNLPLGDRGITGIFDGCPVWVVMGWLSADYFEPRNNTEYIGMLDPASTPIRSAWEAELALPLAPALAHQRSPAQMIQPMVQLLLLQ
jgi:hypothetical protein